MSDSLAMAPAEDRGLQTASWYRFQYAVTVRECLEVLRAGRGGVIVEWHADFIRRKKSNEPLELNSVKHRTLDRGPWSLAELGSQCLRTLFMRWAELGGNENCVAVLNAGLKTGDMEARALANAIASGTRDEITAFAEKLAPRLEGSVSDVSAFLSRLSIREVGADESAIDSHLIDGHCRPILIELGVSPANAHGVYSAIFNRVYELASGYSPDEPTSWTAWTSLPEAELDRRTISYRDLEELLANLGIAVDEGVRAALDAPFPPGSVMRQKLERGGLGPSVLAGAPQLRANWYAIETQFREDLPAGSADEVARLRKLVLNKAMNVESLTRGAEPYGPAMHMALADSLNEPLRTTLQVDAADLMGCAYQLTDECRVWWSEPFTPTLEPSREDR